MQPSDINIWRKLDLRNYIRTLVLDQIDKRIFELDKVSNAELTKITEDLMNLSNENAKQLDGHLLYIAGGALALISQIFVSDKFNDLLNLWILTISFCLLSICIVIFSFSFVFVSRFFLYQKIVVDKFKIFLPSIQELSFTIKKQNAGLNFTNYIYSRAQSIENEEVDTVYKRLEANWEEITMEASKINVFYYLAKIFNIVTLATFSISIIFFMFFGLTNFLKIDLDIINVYIKTIFILF